MMFFSITKFSSIFGVMTVEWQRSMKDRLVRKKYIGAYRWELSRIRVIIPIFPTTVTM
jgi:hypothetical protein